MPSKRISRLLKILTGATAQAEEEIFQLDGRLERCVHFWALVWRQFVHHRCLARAAALSYSTLLALIPLIAIALSVTNTLLQQQDVEKLSRFVEKAVASLTPPATIGTNAAASPPPPGSLAPPVNAETDGESGGLGTNRLAAASLTPPPEPLISINVQKEIARWVHDLVQKTSSRALGVTGMVILIFTAISLLRGIEETFNDIWGVTRGRNWWLQIMLYWTIITLGPLLLVPALGLTGSVHLQNTRTWLESSPWLAPLFDHILPISIFSLMLALFYKLTPNTKVKFRAAVVGGLVAGTTWHFYNQLSFLLASRAFSANQFYGSLFLVVLLMSGLYFIWLIVLFGAQVAYAYQNRAAYLQDRLADNINQRGREFVALRLMTCLGQRFQSGLRPATVMQLAAELNIPSRLIQSVLRTLCATRLVTEIAGAEAAFTPARPLAAINAYDILLALRTGAGQELPVNAAAGMAEIYGEFARIEQAERTAASTITLQALVNRLPQTVALPEPEAAAAKVEILDAALAVVSAPPPIAEVKTDETVEPVAEPVRENLAAAAAPPATPEPVVEKTLPRRETVRPGETDFPL